MPYSGPPSTTQSPSVPAQQSTYNALIAQAQAAERQAQTYEDAFHALFGQIEARTDGDYLGAIGVGKDGPALRAANRRDGVRAIEAADAAVNWYRQAAQLYRQAGEAFMAESCIQTAQSIIDMAATRTAMYL